MIYKEDQKELEKPQSILLDPNSRGYQLAKKMGYQGIGGLNLHKRGQWDPIIVEHRKKNMGLGYKPKDVVTPKSG